MGKTYLNLACGRDYRQSSEDIKWINIDNQQMYHGDFKVDLKADIFELDNTGSNDIDLILVNHFIQYVTPASMVILLKRWHRWLKPSGELIIEAGNILKVCENIVNAKTVAELHDKNGIMQLYGIDDNIWNKWAWCPMSLRMYLEKAGFKDIKEEPGYYHQNPERDFLIKATK